MRAARDALSPAARAEATTALGAALAGLPEFVAAGTVAAFAAAGSEVDLRAAMDRARAAGGRVV
jgi:5-formyltetrahydrofolate cyclo-ligase